MALKTKQKMCIYEKDSLLGDSLYQIFNRILYKTQVLFIDFLFLYKI